VEGNANPCQSTKAFEEIQMRADSPRRFLQWCARLAIAVFLFLLLPLIALSEHPPTSLHWRSTRALPAPEAKQAAAAHGDIVYAIDNREIGIYDRASGKRRAIASGFVWQDRLYCAHSNYPQQPEKSEILVLDPARMTLETFKDFGAYGGSLTWAVVKDDHWWCNFAKYGPENGATFLVQFDSDWKEIARWTYPAEVIEKLHGKSLSGGIWRGGELVATNHDDPILFRLALPDKGTVLQFIAIDTAPFTGQGFAADPITGGLVGIDRKNRQILFAEIREETAKSR
jgi:hypothetical protein